MYEVSVISDRHYVDEGSVSSNDFLELENNDVLFNRYFFSAYNMAFLKETNREKYDRLLNGNSFHMWVKESFGLNTYFTNSIVRLAEGLIKSQKSNQKNYIEELESKINTKQEIYNKTSDKINNLKLLRDAIFDCFTHLRNGEIYCYQVPKGIKFVKNTECNRVVVWKYDKEARKMRWEEFTLGQFLYQYIQPELKRLRTLLGQYKHRIENLQIKLEKVKILKRAIFGGKNFMRRYSKGQYTKIQFLRHKYKSYCMSGRHDAMYGNFSIRPIYNNETRQLKFQLNLINGKVIYINNMKFPYRFEELVNSINTETHQDDGIPIGCRVDIKYDHHNRPYVQITCSFNIEKTVGQINFDKSTGVIAVDFNAGHLDVSELDEKGNLLGTYTIYYQLYGTSKENEISLRKAFDSVGQLAYEKHKIIVIEDVNLKNLKMKNNSDKKSQKALNRCLHHFPYRRYKEIAMYMRIKYKTEVIVVNPAFTSIVGELKYAYYMKLNIHQAASYVIGRRGLGFDDKPLDYQMELLKAKHKNKKYKSTWSMWSDLNKLKTA